jgi:hypothetical protein
VFHAGARQEDYRPNDVHHNAPIRKDLLKRLIYLHNPPFLSDPLHALAALPAYGRRSHPKRTPTKHVRQ